MLTGRRRSLISFDVPLMMQHDFHLAYREKEVEAQTKRERKISLGGCHCVSLLPLLRSKGVVRSLPPDNEGGEEEDEKRSPTCTCVIATSSSHLVPHILYIAVCVQQLALL